MAWGVCAANAGFATGPYEEPSRGICPLAAHAQGLATDRDVLTLLSRMGGDLRERLLEFLRVETAPKHRRPNVDNVAQLRAMLPARPFVISAARARELEAALGVTSDELLIDLMPIAKDFARPPISRYLVGEAGRAASGDIYLGVNVEFPGHPLFQTIHGEQFLIAAMLLRGERGASAFAMPAAPCGHCRQFMWEMHGASALRIVVPDRSTLQRLPNLLPDPFGPADLGITGALLNHERAAVELVAGQFRPTEIWWSALAEEATEAARASYAPYSGPAGVAVAMRDRSVHRGPYIDNAAFNPSLPSLQVAAVSMVMAGQSFEDVDRVVLVERASDPKSQAASTRALLQTLAPQAEFRVYRLR